MLTYNTYTPCLIEQSVRVSRSLVLFDPEFLEQTWTYTGSTTLRPEVRIPLRDYSTPK